MRIWAVMSPAAFECLLYGSPVAKWEDVQVVHVHVRSCTAYASTHFVCVGI